MDRMQFDAKALQSRLTGRRIGCRLHYEETVDSTNRIALELARVGAPEGTVVLADRQTAGRGRMQRSWQSPPGCNLYLSIILRPTIPQQEASQITLMTGLAAAEAVSEACPEGRVGIKWPNDIMVKGEKLAGILTESSCDRERILYVILGIGVNVNFPRELMPESIRGIATSLLILGGKAVDRSAFVLQLIQNLERCYGELEEGGFSFLAERWAGFFRLKGKRVRVQMLEQAILGKAMGIDIDGALILEDERGFVQRIIAGEVIPMES